MNKKTRLIVAFIVVDAMLAGIWLYLVRFGMDNPDSVAADFQRTVGQTMGAAMGAFLGLGVILFFVAARNDRKAIETKARR
jgi:hypothetical protein